MNLKQLILNILSSHYGLEERGEGRSDQRPFSLPPSPIYAPASSGSSRGCSPPRRADIYLPEQFLGIGAMTEYDLVIPNLNKQEDKTQWA